MVLSRPLHAAELCQAHISSKALKCLFASILISFTGQDVALPNGQLYG
jgi:hypothetical protein